MSKVAVMDLPIQYNAQVHQCDLFWRQQFTATSLYLEITALIHWKTFWNYNNSQIYARTRAGPKRAVMICISKQRPNITQQTTSIPSLCSFWTPALIFCVRLVFIKGIIVCFHKYRQAHRHLNTNTCLHVNTNTCIHNIFCNKLWSRRVILREWITLHF